MRRSSIGVAALVAVTMATALAVPATASSVTRDYVIAEGFNMVNCGGFVPQAPATNGICVPVPDGVETVQIDVADDLNDPTFSLYEFQRVPTDNRAAFCTGASFQTALFCQEEAEIEQGLFCEEIQISVPPGAAQLWVRVSPSWVGLMDAAVDEVFGDDDPCQENFGTTGTISVSFS